jgi:putative heme-binding domain-containing protein
MPSAWTNFAPRFYANADQRVQRQAERLAAVFGDASMFPRLREALDNPRADAGLRRHAFAVLNRAQDGASLPVFLRLLGDASFRVRTIGLLARFDSPEIHEALINRFDRFSSAERAAVLNTLTGRVSFALPLLEAVATGKIKRDQLTAFHVRQLTQLNDAEVDKHVSATWGAIHQSPAEQRARIVRLEKVFEEAPLWAYSGGAGREHFLRLCSPCHRIGNDGNRIGPELTGAGKNGVRYFLENIIDPDAVIGADFQMTTVETRNGDVISGLVTAESSDALTIRTVTDQIVLAKKTIVQRTKSEKSMMPEGLLESLSDREQLELLKFLTSN